MHESGLIKILSKKWWPSSRVCDDGSKTEWKPVSLLDVQGAFYLAAGKL